MQFFFKSGSLARDGWDVRVDQSLEGWKHTGMRVGNFAKQRTFTIDADNCERLIWPLEGKSLTLTYSVNGAATETVTLQGRVDVFHGPTDLQYLSIQTSITITGDGRFVVAEAPAKNQYPATFIPRDRVPILIRGTGPSTRQVHNVGSPEELVADRFIVAEVIVPSGNWSGTPGHKHDTYIPGVESNLEEIYYFESALARSSSPHTPVDPIGYIRGRSADERPFELLEEVRSGDVALIPYGWHGPAMATPGYDLYFMNVMAGPDPDRAWNITDDPTQAWIRKEWEKEPADPRLPYLA